MQAAKSDLQSELDANYRFFSSQLDELLTEREGQYALIWHCEFVDFFPDGYQAFRAGQDAYPDQLFSVQQISDRVLDLGIFSRV